jgi:hypothetical protein
VVSPYVAGFLPDMSVWKRKNGIDCLLGEVDGEADACSWITGAIMSQLQNNHGLAEARAEKGGYRIGGRSSRLSSLGRQP